MVFSIRTIFLFIRGIDQTGRALEDPRRKLTELEKAQQQLARSGYRLMFAGAAFTAFGIMAGRAMLDLLENTSRGERVLSDFEKVFTRLKKALAEQIIDMFGDTITGWLEQLDNLAKNDLFMKILAGTLFATVETLITVGPVLIAAGGAALFLAALGKALGLLGFTTLAGGLATVAGAITGLALALVLTILIKELIWQILPEDQKKFITEISEWFDDILSNIRIRPISEWGWKGVGWGLPGEEPSWWPWPSEGGEGKTMGPAEGLWQIILNIFNTPGIETEVVAETGEEVLSQIGGRP